MIHHIFANKYFTYIDTDQLILAPIIQNHKVNPDNNNPMVYTIEDYPHPINAALVCQPQSLPQFHTALALADETHCDTIITPIFPDPYLRELGNEDALSLDHCFILSDQHLKKYQLGMITPFINQCVWHMPIEGRKKFMILLIGYASYLNLRYFALKITDQDYQSICETLSDKEVASELKKCVPNLVLIMELSGDNDENGKEDDRIWRRYIDFRTKLEEWKFPLYIEVALEMKANCPLNRIINRWKSQKIAYIILSTNCFTENAKGFVILPARHQRIAIELLVLRALFSVKLDKIPSNRDNTSNNQNSKHLSEYYKYIIFVFQKFAQNKLRSQKQAINLQDYLQNPLQPYADNLESATYEVFENDEQKYDEYQSALQDALQTFPKNKKIILYYIGSGRGGLLFNVFAAAKKTQRKVFVYAIEKNLYPIQTIKKRLRQNKWQNNVKIIHTDIRNYQMPQHPDIFLSELLGGFGDNELSPECLYWAEKNVASDTICIPKDSVSYIRPVSYQYMHRKIEPKMRQIYYTVNYGNYYTCFQSQQVWKFEHPILKPKPQDPTSTTQQLPQPTHQEAFNRYSKTTFSSPKQDIIINGFAGYFTSSLHTHTELSILPERPTLGMYSWYPIFFCFTKAELLRKGENIQIQLWRKNTQKKVWYQWRYRIGDGEVSVLHNQGGSCIAIQI